MKNLVILLLLLVVISTKHSIRAQDLQDVENNFTNTTYWEASTIAGKNKPKVIDGLHIKKGDIPKLQSEFSKLNNIRYLKVNFDNESDLLDIFNFASKLPNLNYILFNEWTFYAKKQDSIQGTLKLPSSFFECTHLKGIKFSGNTKINLGTELEKFKSFPDMRNLFFSMVPVRFIPNSIRSLPIEGLGLDINKDSCPDWLGQISTLHSLDIGGNVLDYNNLFKKLSTLKYLQNLYFKYIDISKNNSKFTQLYNIVKLKIETSKIANSTEFLSTFENSKNLEQLEIIGCTLDQIPGSIGNFTSLKKLSLSFLRRKYQIPESIGNLKKLESLNISEDSLMNLPNNISKLNRLKTLLCQYNQLTQLPSNIGNLKSLISLDISHNRLATLPTSINQLVKLEEIIGEANPLKSLPSISNLQKIRKIDFAYCDLQSLPEDIGKLSQLQELNLSENFLVEIPNNIGDVKNLRILKIDNNILHKLPSSIGYLNNLETLVVSGNLLDSIPVSIGMLRNLTNLSIGNNLITQLPNEINNLNHLEQFSAFSGARYRSREIYRGKENSSNKNYPTKQLLSFPKDLSGWKNIQTISLDGNDFSNDKLVVKAFLTIPANHFKLTMSKCKIDSLPNDWAHFLGSTLDLSRNNIKTLPKDMSNAPYLSELILTHNQLPTSPSNLNSFSESRYEVLIYFAEAGLISSEQLPHNDTMVAALVKKAYQYYNYDKNYGKCVDMFKTSMSINPAMTLMQIDNNALGESQYHIGNIKMLFNFLRKRSNVIRLAELEF